MASIHLPAKAGFAPQGSLGTKLNQKNVVGLFKMSGNYDMLLLAIFKDTLEMEELINKLLAMKEVKDLHGNLSLHTYKFGQCPIPIEED